MACGTPVVSFDSTGLRDIVVHSENGYRAKCFDSRDLCNGIIQIIYSEDKEAIDYNSRQSVTDKFTFEIQANKYIKLYSEILNDDNH
jgi:glycosyltransferase involved in cell wall biosynthesis